MQDDLPVPGQILSGPGTSRSESATPSIDFDKLRKEQCKRDITSYPFTRCHIEDCVIVRKMDGINTDRMPADCTCEIIALEVIFY